MKQSGEIVTTKEEIIKISAKLFAQRGYFGVSMQDIAQKLKITKAALYYHFNSKENLYQEILRVTFSDLWYELKKAFRKGKTPWDMLLNVIEAYLFFSLKRPEVTLFFNEELPAEEKETRRIIGKIRHQLLSFFKKIIKAEAHGRQLASKQIIFLASLLVTVLAKSIIFATLPPRILANQIANLLFPKKEELLPKHSPSKKQLLASQTS